MILQVCDDRKSKLDSTYFAAALVARDKFSKAIDSLNSLCDDLPENSEVLIFDSGYPASILRKFESIREMLPDVVSIIPTQRFANTNVVWNQFVGIRNASFLMSLENDVLVTRGCISDCISAITSGIGDVAVPVVYEGLTGTPHFNPKISTIIDLADGRLISKLDRGREDASGIPGGRRVKHLERHCFVMSQETAGKLGPLDEQMYCRTDYDMSFSCHKKGIVIGIPPKASVIVHPDIDVALDGEFFDHRWNIQHVERANSYLIEKWRLAGFKTTIEHAHEARRQLNLKDEPGRD